MAEPLPLPAVTLTCSCRSDQPLNIGQFLRSARRPRYAYQIVGIKRVKRRLPALGRVTVRLTCARWPAAVLPDGAVVREWIWDRR